MMSPQSNTAKRILGQRGVTLIEVIVVMVIVVILIVISGLGIGLFFRKYKELNLWAELQKDGIECLNYIKNGIPVGSQALRVADNGDFEFIRPKEYFGVVNAVDMKFVNAPWGSATASAIRVFPNGSDNTLQADFAEFALYDGAVRCTYKYRGVQIASPLVLFPKRGKRDKMTLEKFQFRRLNNDQTVYAVEVELQAKVEIAPGKFRRINYRTKMAKK